MSASSDPSSVTATLDTMDGAPPDAALETLAGSGGEQEASDGPLGPGASVGRYVVLSALGTGAMGVVFAAYDPQLDRKVALKLLKPRGRGRDRARARLHREAQTLAKLNHRNVVTVHDVGVHDGRVFVAMEFIAGRTLRAWSDQVDGVRPWKEVVSVFVSAGRGLAAAHAKGLIHRDFKPDNVMVGDDGSVRVMDFGLARGSAREDGARPDLEATLERLEASSSDPREASLTKTGDLMGTPVYMAPEQFSRDSTHRSDQFGFCVSMFEALHGVRPFEEDSWRALISKSTRAQPPDRDVPWWLQAVLDRGLQPDPDARFESMDALLAAIALGERHAGRRRLAWGAAGVLTVGLIAAAVPHWRRARADAACRDAGASIGAVWNEGARSTLAQTAARSGLPYAPTMLAYTTEVFDARRDAWAEAKAQACRTARVQGEWDAPTLARVDECLDDRAIEMEALLHELGRGDVMALQHAADAATKLGRPRACLAAASAPSARAPNRSRPELREVRAGVLQAAIQLNAGHVEDALVTAQEAVARAEAIGDEGLLAAAQAEAGWALDQLGRFDEAGQRLSDAYFGAIRAGDTDTAIEAATDASYTFGHELRRASEGMLWSRLAEAALDQQRAPEDDVRRAKLFDYRGIILAQRREYADAAALHHRAIEIESERLGETHPAVASSLGHLATVVAAQGRLDEALALHERARGILEDAFGEAHPQTARSLVDIGIVKARSGRPGEARALLERALASWTASLGPDHPRMIITLLSLAHLEIDAHAFAQARVHLERALAMSKAAYGPHHSNTALLLRALGRLESERGDLDAALAAYEASREAFEGEEGRDDPVVADVLDDLAHALGAVGRPSEAATARARASEIRARP
ncbi:MAG: tetratricopeptide repeat protein [Nannocystaceae bacterium]|nr:serine/threonine-protein kinase [bacterium]